MQNKRARILFCEGNIDGTVGGSFFSLLYLVGGLDKTAYEPIVVFHNEHTLLPSYRAAGVETLIVPAYRPARLYDPEKSGRMARLLAPLMSLAQKSVNLLLGFVGKGFSYASLMRRLDADLLHLNNSIIRNNDWMLGAWLAGVPCITHERGINTHYPRLSRLFARRLKAIICISGAVRSNLQSHGVNYGNLVTIYNGIDPSIVHADASVADIRRRHGLSPSTRIVGVVGNIKPWKGQETMVRALPMVLAKIPDAACLLVGDTSPADQSYLDRLKHLADELGVAERLHFTGYTRGVADYMNAMEAVIHTSIDDEPFGRVLIEAMALCKPVIGARGGAVPEIVEEGVTGFTFTPGDPVALAAKITELLANPAKAATMGQHGRLRLEKYFHIRSNIEQTENVYARILNSAASRRHLTVE